MTHDAALMELIELVERLADACCVHAGLTISGRPSLREQMSEVCMAANELYTARRDAIAKGIL